MKKLEKLLALELDKVVKAFLLNASLIEYGVDTETDDFLKWNMSHKGHEFSIRIDKKTFKTTLIY